VALLLVAVQVVHLPGGRVSPPLALRGQCLFAKTHSWARSSYNWSPASTPTEAGASSTRQQDVLLPWGLPVSWLLVAARGKGPP